MRSRVAFAGLVLLVLLAFGAVVGSMLGSGARARYPSSFAGEPEGLLAFRRLLGELEVPATTLKQPWHRLDPGTGLLIAATPFQRPVSREEREALAAWLEQGGALLLIDDATALETTQLLEELMNDAALERAAPLGELDLQTFLPGRPPTTECRGTPASPSSAELRRIVLHEGSRFTGEFDALPLALRRDGAVVAAEGRLGAGRIVRVLGPLLSNDRLLGGDNLELALRLVEDLRESGPVVFDEFHHGYGGMLAGFRKVERSAIAWALVQALLVTALYALARGVRFGPPRLVPPALRRSSLEFVHSMADLYRRAGHRGKMLGRMLERFEREARARWALDERLELRELAAAIARRTEVPEARLAETLGKVAVESDSSRLDEKQMLAHARELDRLRQEVFGGAGTAA